MLDEEHDIYIVSKSPQININLEGKYGKFNFIMQNKGKISP